MTIEAMKQALEALEYAQTGNRRPEVIGTAITTLRTAIKQAEKQEPVAWPTMPPSRGQSPVLFEDGYAEGWAKCLNACKAAHITPPAAPVQEPVAYRFKERPDDLRSAWRYVSKKQHVPHGWPYQSLSITGGNK